MEKKNYTESNQVDNRVNNNEDEIDVVEIVKKLWRNRRFIFKVTAVFAILGLLAAISSPNVYTASCTMVLQSGNNSSGGSFGGLAALAGINLGSAGSGAVLSPAVYPKIMSNINFQKEFIYSKFNFDGVEQPITLYDYYTDKKYQKFNLIGTIKKYTIGLPGVIIGLPGVIVGALKSKSGAVESKKDDINHSDSTSIQSLTAGEKGVSNIIKGNLLLINNKDGSINLTSNMPEPLVAAELVQKGLELLQKYITRFKIEKVTSNLEFVERSYEEAKRNFEAKQEALARFRDSNKSFASAVAKTQEEKLMSEYTLLLGIYTELAKQKEQAKIAVTETTPILTVIEPVIVPIEKTQSKRFMKLFIYTFLGFIIGVGIVFFVTYLKSNFIPDIKKYRFIPKIN